MGVTYSEASFWIVATFFLVKDLEQTFVLIHGIVQMEIRNDMDALRDINLKDLSPINA